MTAKTLIVSPYIGLTIKTVVKQATFQHDIW